MKKQMATAFLCVTSFAIVAGGNIEKTRQLVSNPTFRPIVGSDLPPGWTPWAPDWAKAACRFQSTPDGLLIDAPNDPFAVGGVFQDIEDIEPNQTYAVKARCLIRVPDPYRSVLMRLTWTRGGKPLHPAGMLVRGPTVWHSSLASFGDVLVAPDKADGARLSLEVKWPGDGSVKWMDAGVMPAPMPAPRKVKVGAVYLRPRNSTPQNNLKLWCEQIDAAGKLGLDIVCLGETITAVGTSAKLEDCAEPIPGPSTRELGRAAKKNNIWVVASLNERIDRVVCNTGVLIDRTGKIAGRYRKVHLPREEWKKGVRPGDGYPVFETDFGKVAIQICYDWFFPEPEAVFALKGAEIIFAPTWGNTLPDRDGRVDGRSVFRVRARDNGVYMVPSVYSGESLIIDPMGRVLASSNGQTGVFWAEIDLNKREPLDWVGYWRSIGPRHRMPETYAPLLQSPKKPTY